MSSMTQKQAQVQDGVIVGVDCHQQTHHAVAIDSSGRLIADQQFPATGSGAASMHQWAIGWGPVTAFGIESTGSYGAGLTRHLTAAGVSVIEVNRPDVVTRRAEGKADQIDAYAAARAVLSGRARAIAKNTTGVVESIRILKLTRDSAITDRTAAYGQMRDVITTAPDALRERLLPLSTLKRVAAAAALRPDRCRPSDPEQATKLALRSLARRIQALTEEIAETDAALSELLAATAPTLLAQPQVGIQSAAQLLITAGQNHARITSEAAFARLCGVAPIPASSGKTNRMRLDRGGDRHANSTLYLITIGRLRNDERTRAYMQRRLEEGLSKRDIIRCLKRYIARELWTALKTDLTALDGL